MSQGTARTGTVRIQLKKGRDSRPTLVCIRSDGSRTWGNVHPHFPLHDLTHYAVESVIGLTQAFFGLVGAGWAIEDFAQPGAAARLPAEALVAEHIVALFDLERATGQLLRADDLNDHLSRVLNGKGPAGFRAITDLEVARIRQIRRDLQSRWATLAPGETLELEFPAG